MTNRRRSQILLVDDDASTIQLLGHMLAQEGEIRFTTSGTEALRMVRETVPDLILLDIDMPEKNGLEICRTLQADPRMAQVPVIILTSHAQAATEVWALEVGAADFIAKPLIASQVLARVRSQLRRSQSGEAGAEAPDAQDPQRGTRILIVDDDAGSIQCIRLALGSSAEQFQFATSGEEALRAVAKSPPDLILLDAQMPGIDGFEVCRRLQDNPAFSHVPIVFVTRFSDPASEARAMDLGASDFIGKPYKPAVLKARVRNILRRKLQAHAALKAQQAQWQRLSDKRVSAIVDAASDAILTADAEGHIVLINKAACAMFQLSTEQALGRPLRSLLNWQPQPGGEDAAAYRGMKTFVRADGASVTVEASTSQIGQGADQLTTVVLRDLTERERTEAEQRARIEAETASQTKNLLLSYIAHEIGNPLNGILGFAQLILADPANPLTPTQAMRVNHILQSGQHLQSLMRDVLDLSRFEAGTLEVHLEEIDIGACVREAVRLLQADATAAGVHLSCSTPGEGVKGRGDRARLLQCLINLLSNGIKYNRPQGHVDVRLEPSDGQVRITVSDSGMGMSPAQVQHLFEPFNRLGRDASIHGSGIGLAVTHHLIRAMGGQIDVNSIAGEGSRFVVSLPVWAPATSASAPAS